MKYFLTDGPLVTVIVPVYNVGKILERCLDSILKQSYKHIELLIIDDASTNETDQKIELKYLNSDDRVKVIRHDHNQGLFQARITGIENASGKYVLFVDADDYLSFDWIRGLLKKALNTDSDIVVGEWCFSFPDDAKTYLNLDPFRIEDYDLKQPEIIDTFLQQKCSCFSWHAVWNKLYSKNLWIKCLPDFKEYSQKHGKMGMWEDFAFSINLFLHASHLTNVHDYYYYYYKHDDAMTASNRTKKFGQTYLNDVNGALSFGKQQLIKYPGCSEHLNLLYQKLESAAERIVYQDLVVNNKRTGWYYKSLIKEEFPDFEFIPEREDTFFYALTTNLENSYDRYQAIKESIVDTETNIVSFDIFDTLLVRPFIYPTDLFEILSNKLNEQTSSYVDFALIRKKSEEEVRIIKQRANSSDEDITLTEIYTYIKNSYELSDAILQQMFSEELSLESALLKPRKTGMELYQLALEAGKTIIFTSDMYLPLTFIEEVLKNNGYSDYYKIYLSSEIKLTKATGHLFKYILDDLNVRNARTVLHIGDNYQSDVESPRALNIRAEHIPKTSDVYLRYSDIYGGDLYNRTFRDSGLISDYGMLFDTSAGLRSVMSVGINRIFDNPFVSFNRTSDFNSDPRYIGYHALGGYVYSIARWIKSIAEEKKIPCVHFVARDGWLLKKSFDIINDNENVKSDYIRLSRKTLILCDVNSKDDIYSLSKKINIYAASPEKLYQCLNPVLQLSEEQLTALSMEHQLQWDKKFADAVEYERCMKLFIEEAFSLDLLNVYKDKLKSYFNHIIHEGDYIFDIGYSGRPEAALSNLLGFPVGSFYLHRNGDEMAERRQNKYKFENFCFYPVKPCITGAIREHCLMELGPTTIGYRTVNGHLEPEFGEFHLGFAASLITRVLQENAIQYVNDIVKIFGRYRKYVYFNNFAAAAPYEIYLHFAKEFDKHIFSVIPFEDDLNTDHEYMLLDFWNGELNRARLHSRVSERDLEARLIDAENRVRAVYASYSYRIGNKFVHIPFLILKKLGLIKM